VTGVPSSAQYNVQRSSNLQDWSVIGSVTGNGGTVFFTDPAVGNATQAFYRLALPDVWIALRTDGRTGSGTQADPYDGSSANKIATVLNNFIPAYTSIHFGPGNYSLSGITPKIGVNILGAGKDLTIFTWNGEHQLAMISSFGVAHGTEVSDLTLDGRQQVWGQTPAAIGFFDCNDVSIRNVRATNFKGAIDAEAFPFFIFCQNVSVTGGLIENCEVDHFVRGTPLTFPVGATLLGLGHGGGGIPSTRVTGIVANNYIHDCPNVQAIGGGGTNSLYVGNLVVGSDKGWYHDSYQVSGSVVDNNQFLNCTHYGIVSSSNASGFDNPNNSTDRLTVSNNTITMDPSIMVPVSGIALGKNYVTNSQVFGNTVTKETAVYTQFGFLLIGPGTIAHDNWASPGFTNIIP
jgi:hypothetical protein